MKLKINDVLNLEKEIRAIMVKEMSPRFSLKISRIYTKLDSEIKLYEEQRKKIINKYAIKDENGQPKEFVEKDINGEEQKIIRWENDKIPEVNKEYSELVNLEIEIDISKITMDDLEKEDIKLTPVNLINLEKIIEE